MDLSILPPINAALNATATLLLIFGRRLAVQGQVARHKRVMLTAFAVSSLFLLLYVSHKVSRNFENTTLNVEGWAKSAYLVLLGSHVLLAMTVPVFAITLIYAFLIVAPLNLLLGTNYMYLRGLPATGSVLDLLGPWPWYIAGGAVFTLASFVFYYLPFWLKDVVSRRRRD